MLNRAETQQPAPSCKLTTGTPPGFKTVPLQISIFWFCRNPQSGYSQVPTSRLNGTLSHYWLHARGLCSLYTPLRRTYTWSILLVWLENHYHWERNINKFIYWLIDENVRTRGSQEPNPLYFTRAILFVVIHYLYWLYIIYIEQTQTHCRDWHSLVIIWKYHRSQWCSGLFPFPCSLGKNTSFLKVSGVLGEHIRKAGKASLVHGSGCVFAETIQDTCRPACDSWGK